MALAHVVMVSLDAVTGNEAEWLAQMPAVGALARRGTLTTGVASVFVSNTYPAHASIVSGQLPHVHRITENCLYQPQYQAADWYWYRRGLQGDTVYDAACRAGLTTCNVMWPVTAGADITWNMPEIFVPRQLWKQPYAMLQNGSKVFQLGAMARHIWRLKAFMQPGVDNFLAHTAADAIRKHTPGLTMVHLTDVDVNKHHYGPKAPEVEAALERLDGQVGLLMQAVERAGMADTTGFVLLGDHGCMPVERCVDPNQLLGRYESVAGWQLAGGTAFLRERQANIDLWEDVGLREALLAYAAGLCGTNGILRMLDAEEMQVSGMDTEAVCGIEAAPGVSFGEKHAGQHGYSLRQPADLYTTFHLTAAPSGTAVRQQGGCITDVAGLVAEMLGITMDRHKKD